MSVFVPVSYGYNEKWMREYYHYHKYGYNPSVGNTWSYLWINGTDYPFLTSAIILSVSSTDVDDDNGDTGAWNITLLGLDENYNEQNETIVLDGQNPVNTVNKYLRVHRAYIRKTGNSETNEGDIYVGSGAVVLGVPLNEYLRIENNEGQSHMAIYTVPAGKTGYIMRFGFSSTEDKAVEYSIEIREYGEGWRCKEHYGVFRASIIYEYMPPRVVPEKSDIVMRAKVSTGTAITTGVFDIILIDSDKPLLSEISEGNIAPYLIIILVIIIALVFLWRLK